MGFCLGCKWLVCGCSAGSRGGGRSVVISCFASSNVVGRGQGKGIHSKISVGELELRSTGLAWLWVHL